ncbi:Ig-like domain-containing protein [Streptomyces sp. WAC 06725]|uniref:L,D-transpeptidase n=1 Tax=Streptomyces sp. WAC 06725 TaxID=2203209 RepID=UPI0021AD7887|nr:Ig-like domain-containing protein [Streptomyces sp. WAC 06725]
MQQGQPVTGARRAGPRRSGGVLALLLAALLILVTACGGGDEGKGGGTDPEKQPSQANVTITPKDGAKDVATDGGLKVSASGGRLTSVKVVDDKGAPVAGKLSGGSVWQPTGKLRAATTYKVDAVAVDDQLRESARHATFTTLVPKNTFVGRYVPEDGQTVGVGMPVSVNFTRGITDPERIEQAIKVTAEPAVPIASHWFGNDRLDFRPEKYWKPGTKVTLSMDLKGVEGRPGVYGTQTKRISFTIGRSQISTVDVKAKEMSVVRDGKKIKTIPVTAGGPGTETYNGQMVISEKHEVTRMNGETVGFGGEYDIADVPHAMRLSTSGTFIHGNYWSGRSTFGSRNASHGCVGLFDQRGGGDGSTPAAWFYANSLIGDVVTVVNSHDETIAPDNGLNVWNMSWDKWRSGR